MIDPLFTLPGLLKALVILLVIVALDVTHVLITATQRIVPGRHRASRESPQEGIAPQSRLEEVRHTSCPGVGHGGFLDPPRGFSFGDVGTGVPDDRQTDGH